MCYWIDKVIYPFSGSIVLLSGAGGIINISSIRQEESRSRGTDLKNYRDQNDSGVNFQKFLHGSIPVDNSLEYSHPLCQYLLKPTPNVTLCPVIVPPESVLQSVYHSG